MALFKRGKKETPEQKTEETAQAEQTEQTAEVQAPEPPKAILDSARVSGVFFKIYRWVFSVSLNFNSYQIESGDSAFGDGALPIRGYYAKLIETLREKVLDIQKEEFTHTFSPQGLKSSFDGGRSYVQGVFYCNMDLPKEDETDSFAWFEFRAERIPEEQNRENYQLLLLVRRVSGENDDGKLPKPETLPVKQDGEFDWSEIRVQRLINNDKMIYYEYDINNDVMFTHRRRGEKQTELREERWLKTISERSDQMIFHDSIKKVVQLFKSAMEGASVETEILYRKDGLQGAPFNYYVMASRPLEEMGKPTWLFGSLKNVDSTVREREQNREIMQQMDNMLGNFYTNMFQIDINKKVIYHIERTDNGFEREKTPQKIETYVHNIVDRKVVDEEGAKEYLKWLQPGYINRMTLRGNYEFEARLRLKNAKEYRMYSETIIPVQGRDGVYMRLRRDIDDVHQLRKKQFELEENVRYAEYNSSVLDTMASLVEFRNVESGMHITRVRKLTEILLNEIARRNPQYGLTQKIINLYVQASTIHDIGKITVPDSILNKPGRYTKEEYEIIKTHTTNGAIIVDRLNMRGLEEMQACCRDVVLHHHERFDGKGYPEGLSGDKLSIGVQAVSLADVYDALVNVRCYKEALSFDEARRMIFDGECGTFNPDVLDSMLAVEQTMRGIYKLGEGQSAEEDLAAEALLHEQTIMEDNN